MRLQDLHPYDSFIVGINNIYFVDSRGDFHIIAPFIISNNQTLSTGCTYVLIESCCTKKYIVRQVRLQDAYYSEGVIFLIVRDINSQETYTINQQMKCPRDHFKWILIDFGCIVEEMNTEVIKSYHGSCKCFKMKSDLDSKHEQFIDDLLEFDF